MATEELAEPLEWTIGAADAGQRIDKVIADKCEEAYSRSQIQTWLKNGDVTVGGAPVKASYKVQEGDNVLAVVPEPEPLAIEPENIPLDIVYEDGDVIVVNKPRGMVVHPAPGHRTGTLVGALLHHCGDLAGIGGVKRPGIVHRIDKDTSGLLMAAKNDVAHASLAAQLKAHTVTRRYIALAHGKLAHDNGTIDAPIGRDVHDRKLFAVTERNSKHAVTHFAVLERWDDYSLLELKLETGRTHQIRVHLKFIGHPIVGDPAYGRSKGNLEMAGQALHAAVLGFQHPRTNEYLEFRAALPADMEHVLHAIRNR
ncbi:MAG: RluA family pseudouridine synthase [Paenibacillaceae bacterium]|nr:RluA family pseudouridine synthase [Paenibacillaceae bacterium]